ncbi:MAG: DUF4845 domain-containing protein [Pseudomonadota bacterium]
MRYARTPKMVRSRQSQQRGRTALGVLILVLFVGLFVYGGIRLVPVYLEDMKISSTFESVETELGGQNATRREILSAIEKRFDVDSVKILRPRDVEVKKVETGYELSVSYINTVPFLANVSFACQFNHRVIVLR